MHNQVHAHFHRLKLYFSSQYGFREMHSTELAAIELIDRVTQEMDNNNISINIYLDLSKAFDTLNHQILLYKLNYYGIRTTALKLFENYLTSRKQCVEFNGSLSDYLTVTTGVPQGSILGPLLFIIYINDIVSVSNIFYPIIYADDTTLSTTLNVFNDRNNILNIENSINIELDKISIWLKLNKLSLNVNKTKACIPHPSTSV